MPETDALGLDYCISTPEVQLIQSQPVVHNNTCTMVLRLRQRCIILACVVGACRQRRVAVIILVTLEGNINLYIEFQRFQLCCKLTTVCVCLVNASAVQRF